MASTAFRFPHDIDALVEDLAKARDNDHAWRTFAAHLADNFKALEDHLRLYVVQWSYSGALTAGAVSTPYRPKNDQRLTEVIVWLGTAGSSNTVVTVKVNGSSVGTVTLASGDTQKSVTFETKLLSRTDVLTMELTTAGTGAADLSAEAVLR